MSGGLWDLVLPASRTGQVVRQTECDHERQTRHDRGPFLEMLFSTYQRNPKVTGNPG
jgi:hypothetical protein